MPGNILLSKLTFSVLIFAFLSTIEISKARYVTVNQRVAGLSPAGEQEQYKPCRRTVYEVFLFITSIIFNPSTGK
jgi:hypothetical protein